MSKIAEGRMAPDFTLEDAEGRRRSLAAFKGKDVVVSSYPKDDTPCTKEACGFRDLGVIRSTVWVGPDGSVRKLWARPMPPGALPRSSRTSVVGPPEALPTETRLSANMRH